MLLAMTTALMCNHDEGFDNFMVEPALGFKLLDDELLDWLADCQASNGEGAACVDPAWDFYVEFHTENGDTITVRWD